MSVLPAPAAIREVPAEAIRSDPALWTSDDTPWIARGMVGDWPIVDAAQSGDGPFLDYLL